MPRFAFALLALAVLPSISFAESITLNVDASEVGRKVIHVREVIPAQPGQLTLQIRHDGAGPDSSPDRNAG